LILGILLPFVALVGVGGLLTLLLVRRGIGEVKGLWQTTGSKNPPALLRKELPAKELPAPELKTRYKPHEQSAQEKDLPASTSEENATHGNLWRW
jgi:hypothetical protein